MKDTPNRVCPVEQASFLDNKFRRLLQNPQKIMGVYIEPGMTVLDMGCGTGFFSIDMAKMVGPSGHVIAADVQEGMLSKLRAKIEETEIESRITLHKCEKTHINLSTKIDFVLLFYMAHEVPSQEALFKEIDSILKPNGKVLVVEPPFHVSKAAFAETVNIAREAGYTDIKGPKILLSKTVLLKR